MFKFINKTILPNTELQKLIYTGLKDYTTYNIGDNKNKIDFPAIVFGKIESEKMIDKTAESFLVTIVYITGSNSYSRIETEEMLADLYSYHALVLTNTTKIVNYTLDLINVIVASNVEKDGDLYKGMATYKYYLTKI